METHAPAVTITIAPRKPRRVRFDIDEAKADKLRAVAAKHNRSQSSLIETFIDSLPDPAKSS